MDSCRAASRGVVVVVNGDVVVVAVVVVVVGLGCEKDLTGVVAGLGSLKSRVGV